MVIFMYGYGAAKPGQYKRLIYASATQVEDGAALDRALYTLYECLRVQRRHPTVTPTKNGIRVSYIAE